MTTPSLSDSGVGSSTLSTSPSLFDFIPFEVFFSTQDIANTC